MTTPTPEPPMTEPPTTGHPVIDAALAAVRLDEDVHAHPDELSRALDVITDALRGAPRPPAPAVPRP